MRKGQKASEETRRKMSLAQTGKKKPWAKNSPTLFKKGMIPWNTGTKGLVKPNSGNFKKGQSASPKTQFKKGDKGHLGKPHSEATKKKISLSRIGKTVGNKNPAWKGGITPQVQLIRRSMEYRLWRKAVFGRDRYACVWCGAKSGIGKKVILHADHIKRFSDYPELRFAIDNGRTLCIDCHKTTETYAGKKQSKI